MLIKDVMKLGCAGMDAGQMVVEQERRMKVCERLNKLDAKMKSCEDKGKQARLKKELRQIKASENVWLKQVAWFLY